MMERDYVFRVRVANGTVQRVRVTATDEASAYQMVAGNPAYREVYRVWDGVPDQPHRAVTSPTAVGTQVSPATPSQHDGTVDEAFAKWVADKLAVLVTFVLSAVGIKVNRVGPRTAVAALVILVFALGLGAVEKLRAGKPRVDNLPAHTVAAASSPTPITTPTSPSPFVTPGGSDSTVPQADAKPKVELQINGVYRCSSAMDLYVEDSYVPPSGQVNIVASYESLPAYQMFRLIQEVSAPYGERFYWVGVNGAQGETVGRYVLSADLESASQQGLLERIQ